MCDTCGCGGPETRTVAVDLEAGLLERNQALARHNREHFARRGLLVVNLLGSPGSGKTALLEATARTLGGRLRAAAITGDLETDRDAVRLRDAGLPAVAITTGSACHLDAAMVHRAIDELPPDPLDVLFVENVGNLVCPALFDLGESRRVVALSVTEGVDKPLKYPAMFRTADLVVLTKADLLPHVGVSVAELEGHLARVMPRAASLVMAASKGFGLDAWIGWLQAARDEVGSQLQVT